MKKKGAIKIMKKKGVIKINKKKTNDNKRLPRKKRVNV